MQRKRVAVLPPLMHQVAALLPQKVPVLLSRGTSSGAAVVAGIQRWREGRHSAGPLQGNYHLQGQVRAALQNFNINSS